MTEKAVFEQRLLIPNGTLFGTLWPKDHDVIATSGTDLIWQDISTVNPASDWLIANLNVCGKWSCVLTGYKLLRVILEIS